MKTTLENNSSFGKFLLERIVYFSILEKDAFWKKIAEEPIKLELKTRTDLALKMADDELFTKAGGDRPDKPNVMIVLTDGKPTHPKKGFDFKAFAKEISKDFNASVNRLG